ncbi:hypothetical protein WJX84_000269 [Apatococcus fuscideae]|uniref:Cytochrome P450 n=1 Tax=Apatococcus fuscideae TaxID=2026836 RepID=A0AAW1SI89_9CHLO
MPSRGFEALAGAHNLDFQLLPATLRACGWCLEVLSTSLTLFHTDCRSRSEKRSERLHVQMADLWQTAGIAISCFLAVVARRLVRVCFREIRIWYSWSKLPHSQSPWSLAGELVPATSLKRHDFYTARTKQLGGIFGIRVGPLFEVCITDPELAAPIFKENKADLYTPLQTVFRKNEPSLFTKPSPEYYRAIRKGVAPAFNSGNLREGFGRLASLMPAVIQYIRQAGAEASVDVFNIAGHVTMDAISLSIFADAPGSASKLGQGVRPRYAELMDPAMQGVVKIMAIPWLRHLTFIPDLTRLHEEHGKMVDRLRTCNPPPASLGGHLLALKDPATGLPLTDGQLEAEMVTLFVAGYDTSTAAISWTLGLIAAHPAVQRKVAAELDSIGLKGSAERPQPRGLSWEDLSQLDYLRKVIKEALRMFTVASGGTVRTLSKPLNIGGYHLAAGMTVQVPFHGIHRNPDVWDRPDDFLTERWDEADVEYVKPASGNRAAAKSESGGVDYGSSSPDQQQALGKQADQGSKARRYMPFSYGLRSCVGQNLANLTMLTFVASLCANFQLELAPEIKDMSGIKEAAVTSLIMSPRDGMPLRCTPWA